MAMGEEEEARSCRRKSIREKPEVAGGISSACTICCDPRRNPRTNLSNMRVFFSVIYD